jgi:hypothetical protein
MSDTERVRAWRDRLKQEGRVPMTIWVTAATQARYEDLALTYHRSPSALAQQALDAYRPDQAAVADAVTDTERLRAFIRAEMAQLQDVVPAAVAAAVSATVTATETVTKPVTAPETATETVTAARSAGTPCVTATATATSTDTRPTGYDPAAASLRAGVSSQPLPGQG